MHRPRCIPSIVRRSLRVPRPQQVSRPVSRPVTRATVRPIVRSVLRSSVHLTTPIVPSRSYSVLTQKETNKLLSNKGFSRFMTRVYGYTGLGIGVAMTSSAAALMLGAAQVPLEVGAAGLVTTLAGSMGIEVIQPLQQERLDDEGVVLKTVDPPLRHVSYWAICAGIGTMFSPSIVMYNVVDSMTVPIAGGMTIAVFGGCMLAETYLSRRGVNVSIWQPALLGGLLTLIGCQVVSLGALWWCGPNAVTSALQCVDIYAGIPLFMGLAMADHAKARDMYYKQWSADHLACSSMLFLNAGNLFVRILQAVSQSRR